MNNFKLNHFDTVILDQPVYATFDGALREVTAQKISIEQDSVTVVFKASDRTMDCCWCHDNKPKYMLYKTTKDYEEGVDLDTATSLDLVQALMSIERAGREMPNCRKNPYTPQEFSLYGYYVDKNVVKYFDSKMERKSLIFEKNEQGHWEPLNPELQVPFYPSKEAAMWDCDTVIVQQDGTTTFQEAKGKKWQLNPTQQALINQLQDILVECQKNKVVFLYDTEEGRMEYFSWGALNAKGYDIHYYGERPEENQVEVPQRAFKSLSKNAQNAIYYYGCDDHAFVELNEEQQ